jgi:hypothetical protein
VLYLFASVRENLPHFLYADLDVEQLAAKIARKCDRAVKSPNCDILAWAACEFGVLDEPYLFEADAFAVDVTIDRYLEPIGVAFTALPSPLGGPIVDFGQWGFNASTERDGFAHWLDPQEYIKKCDETVWASWRLSPAQFVAYIDRIGHEHDMAILRSPYQMKRDSDAARGVKPRRYKFSDPDLACELGDEEPF